MACENSPRLLMEGFKMRSKNFGLSVEFFIVLAVLIRCEELDWQWVNDG